jgi:hypothetical protein
MKRGTRRAPTGLEHGWRIGTWLHESVGLLICGAEWRSPETPRRPGRCGGAYRQPSLSGGSSRGSATRSGSWWQRSRWSGAVGGRRGGACRCLRQEPRRCELLGPPRRTQVDRGAGIRAVARPAGPQVGQSPRAMKARSRTSATYVPGTLHREEPTPGPFFWQTKWRRHHRARFCRPRTTAGSGDSHHPFG